MSLATALVSSSHSNAAFLLEKDIIVDLKYLLLGTDSNSFRFNTISTTPTSSLRVDIILDLSTILPNQIGYLKEFIQLALVIKKLSIVSSSPKTTTTTTNTTRPSLQAFYTCISESLLNFQSFLNGLYNTHSLKNLASLRYYLDDSFTSFRHIYWLYLKSTTLNSYEFLSLLHQYTLFGDTLIKEISLDYFQKSYKPYRLIIKDWLLLGNLNEYDSIIEDLFIKLKDNNSIYLQDHIPSFISPEIGFKIYQIGKSINFLKLYMNDKIWCNDFNNSHSHLLSTYLDPTSIESLYDIVINRLDSLLLNQYLSEISYLNKFLLLSQGDLIYSIINNGCSILDEPASNLSSTQLITLLQDSIEYSSISKNYDPSIYNRLDARLLNINSASTLGWDLFTLDFKLSNQMKYLISSTYKEYLRIFNFLFKILKLKNNLSKSWKNSHSIDYKFKSISSHNKTKTTKKINSYQRKFDLIRHQFISFVDCIFSYISNEILSVNYTNFQNKFHPQNEKSYNLVNNKLAPFTLKNNKAFNLDDLKEIHNDYILSISRSEMFYNEKASEMPLSRILYQLLLIIEAFVKLSTEFQSSIDDLSRIQKLIKLDPTSDLHQYQSIILTKIEKLFSKLGTDIVDLFENDLTLFIKILKSSNDESIQCLGLILES